MIWIGCLRCENCRRDFVVWTFTLIAPVWPVFYRVSWSNEMFPNALKHYETHQKMSLGFNDMDRVPSLRKIPTRLCCLNFCIIAPVRLDLHRVSCSNEMVSNAPKHYETHQNMSLGSNGMVPNAPKHYETHQNMSLGSNGMERVPAFVAKNSDATSLHELLH